MTGQEQNQPPERVTVRVYLKGGAFFTMDVEDFYIQTNDGTMNGKLTDYGFKGARGEVPLYPPKVEEIAAIVRISEGVR